MENIIHRVFYENKPNEKWLIYITEFSISAGKAYLSPIIDYFDGLVVSADFVLRATPAREFSDILSR